MIKRFKEHFLIILKSYGYYGIIRFLFFPILSLPTMIIRSNVNYYNIIKWIYKKKKGFCNHFSAHWSFLSLFYYTRTEAMEILKNKNKIKFLGGGVTKKDFWIYSLYTMNIAKTGIMSIIIPITIIQFSISYFCYSFNSQLFPFVIFFVFFSSSIWAIYLNQNYQIIGNCLIPIFFILLGLDTNYLVLLLLLSVMSILSINSFVLSVFL